MEKCAYCGKEFSLSSNRYEKRIAAFQASHDNPSTICDPCIGLITKAENKAKLEEMIREFRNKEIREDGDVESKIIPMELIPEEARIQEEVIEEVLL